MNSKSIFKSERWPFLWRVYGFAALMGAIAAILVEVLHDLYGVF